MHRLTNWMNVHYDYVTGYLMSSVTGVVIAPYFHVLTTFIVCVITGFAGAFGAHLFKKLIERINKTPK